MRKLLIRTGNVLLQTVICSANNKNSIKANYIMELAMKTTVMTMSDSFINLNAYPNSLVLNVQNIRFMNQRENEEKNHKALGWWRDCFENISTEESEGSLTEYLQENKHLIPSMPTEINESVFILQICTEILRMGQKTLGKFFTYCYFITRNPDFSKHLFRFIVCKTQDWLFHNDDIMNAIKKISRWINAEDREKMHAHFIINNNFVILHIFSHDSCNVKAIFSHLEDKLGPSFPLNSIVLEGVIFENEEIFSCISYRVTLKRIRFVKCKFNIGHFNITEAEAASLINLRQLRITGSSIFSVSPNLNLLKKLTLLSIHGYQFIQLPDSITCISTLEVLKIRYGWLKMIPPSISRLTNLKILVLSHNNLGSIPLSITHLKSLSSLNLSNNKIREIPPEMSNLRELKVLVLNSNDLSDSRNTYCGLESVEKLSIIDSQLDALPGFAYKMNGLREIKCSVEKLKSNLTREEITKHFPHMKNAPIKEKDSGLKLLVRRMFGMLINPGYEPLN